MAVQRNTWNQITPVRQNRPNNPPSTGANALKVGGVNLQSVLLRLDCTNDPSTLLPIFDGFANPFDAESKQIVCLVEISFDGGVNWQNWVSTPMKGSPTGTWGKAQQPYPTVTIPIPQPEDVGGRTITHWRFTGTPSELISAGFSIYPL